MEPYVRSTIELGIDDRQFLRDLKVPHIVDVNSSVEWYNFVKDIVESQQLYILEELYAEIVDKRQRTAETRPSRDTRDTVSENETLPLDDITIYKSVFASNLTTILLRLWTGKYHAMRDRLPNHEEPYNLFELVETVRIYIAATDIFHPQINGEMKKPRGRTETFSAFMTRLMFSLEIYYTPNKWDISFRHYLLNLIVEAHTKNFPNEIEAFKDKLRRKVSDLNSINDILDTLEKYAPREKEAYSGKRSNLDYKESNTNKKNRTDSGTTTETGQSDKKDVKSSNQNNNSKNAKRRSNNKKKSVKQSVVKSTQQSAHIDYSTDYANDWILDTGAAVTVTGHLHFLDKPTKLSSAIEISTAGKIWTATHEGTVHLALDRLTKIGMQAYYVPELPLNVISHTSLMEVLNGV